MIVSIAFVEIFLCICMILWILLRRSVYFLNICIIRVFCRFNRNMALYYTCQISITMLVNYFIWEDLSIDFTFILT
jgi:hypothetical protein